MSECQFGLTAVQFRRFERAVKAYLDENPDRDIVRGRCALPLSEMIRVVLLYLRKHDSQRAIAERFKVGQGTVWRVLRWLMPIVDLVLGRFKKSLGDLADWLETHKKDPVLVDGTLLPIARPVDAFHGFGRENYSGKHKRHGVSVQIVTDSRGNILYMSNLTPGRTNDRRSFTDTGLEAVIGTHVAYGDRGYQGTSMTTPIKRVNRQPLTDDQRWYNKSINSIRAAAERGISHIKRWHILSQPNRLRWPNRLDGYAVTASIIAGLYAFTKAAA